MLVGKLTCQCTRCKRCGFNTWFGKIPGKGHYNPLQCSCLEIPWTEESGKLQSIGSHRVEHDWGNLVSMHMHSSKALILGCSAFFMVQLSHPYTAIRKTISLTIQIFVGKVMSLVFIFFIFFMVFNMLSRFVIGFLPRSKCILILWLQSPSTVILEAKKIKSVSVSTFFPFNFHEVMGLEPRSFAFECWVLSQLFHSLISLSSRGSNFSFSLLYAISGIIYISEVVDISPSNLDSIFWFIQAGTLHDVLCI